MWYGAVAPWASFRINDVIPIYRLIGLGVLILLFRRIPMVLLFHRQIQEIEEFVQAFYMGFFGPIGVSAVFYLYISVDFLNQVIVDGEIRQDAARLSEIMKVVVWFLAVTSIVVHGWSITTLHDSMLTLWAGLSVPIGKVGYRMPQTLSQALSSENSRNPSNIELRRLRDYPSQLRRRRPNQEARSEPPPSATFVLGARNAEEPARPVNIINSPGNSGTQTPTNELYKTREICAEDGFTSEHGNEPPRPRHSPGLSREDSRSGSSLHQTVNISGEDRKDGYSKDA